MLEDVKKREPSCTVGGNVNWYTHYGAENGTYLKKKKNRATILFSNPTPGPISGENYNVKIYMQCSQHHHLQ